MRHIFIINTHSGQKKLIEDMRELLSKKENFEYYIFSTRSKEKEGPLVKRILNYFSGEQIRIYCCGGSGTIRNILNNDAVS